MSDLSDIVSNLYERLNDDANEDTDFGDSENAAAVIPTAVENFQGVVSYYNLPVTHEQRAQIQWSWSPSVLYDEDGQIIDPNDPEVQDDFNFDPVVRYMFGTGTVASEVIYSSMDQLLTITKDHKLGVDITGYVFPVTLSGLRGPTATFTVQIEKDTTPPPKPSTPTVTSSGSVVSIEYDGKDFAGATMPDDLFRVMIRADTINPPVEVVGYLQGAGTYSFYKPAGSLIYVQLFPEDHAYNMGDGSDIAAHTVKSVLDDADLMALLALDATVYVQDAEPVSPPAGSWWWTKTSSPAVLKHTDDGITWLTVPLDGSEYIGAPVMTAGTMIAQWIQSDNISSDSILARHIRVGEVTADKIGAGLLSAQITLSGIIQTADAGSRVVMDSGGITLFDASDNVVISINTDGTSSFYGKATLTELEVAGTMSLTMPGNIMQPGSTLVLQAGLQAPLISPTVTNTWPSIQLKNSVGQLINGGGAVIGRMSNGNIVFSATSSSVSIHSSTGAWIRNIDYSEPLFSCGRTIVNDHMVDIAVDDDEPPNQLNYRLSATNLTTGNVTSYQGTGSNWKFSTFLNGYAVWDNGTRLIVKDDDKLIIHTFTWSGDDFSTTTTTKTVNLGDRKLLARSNFDLGVDSLFAINSGATTEINCYTYSSGSANSNGHFYSPVSSTAINCIGYYNGYVWIASGAPLRIYTLDGPSWNDSGITKSTSIGYTYRHVGNNFESKISPITTFTHKKRARLQLAVSGWTPTTDISHLRYYASFTGTRYAQGETASGTFILTSLLTSGSTAPNSSTFPGTTPAEIRSESGAIVLRADGTGSIPAAMLTGTVSVARTMMATRAKLIRTADLAISGSSWKQLTFSSVEFSAGNLTATTSGITVTYSGIYQVDLGVQFSAAGTRRMLAVYVNGVEVDNGCFRIENNEATFASGGVSGLLNITAGSVVAAYYYSNVSSTLQYAHLSLYRIA